MSAILLTFNESLGQLALALSLRSIRSGSRGLFQENHFVSDSAGRSLEIRCRLNEPLVVASATFRRLFHCVLPFVRAGITLHPALVRASTALHPALVRASTAFITDLRLKVWALIFSSKAPIFRTMSILSASPPCSPISSPMPPSSTPLPSFQPVHFLARESGMTGKLSKWPALSSPLSWSIGSSSKEVLLPSCEVSFCPALAPSSVPLPSFRPVHFSAGECGMTGKSSTWPALSSPLSWPSARPQKTHCRLHVQLAFAQRRSRERE